MFQKCPEARNKEENIITEKIKISCWQLVLLLSLFNIISALSFSQRNGDGEFSIWIILSVVIAYILKFILALPVILCEKYIKVESQGKLFAVVMGIYTVFLTGTAAFDTARFCDFASVCPVPEFVPAVLSALVILPSVYCMSKGIKGLLRGGILIFVMVAVGIVAMCFILLPRIRLENFNPAAYSFSFDNVYENILYNLFSGAELPILFLLLRNYEKKNFKPFVIWNTISALIFLFLMTAAVGSLGAYGETQLYPLYTAFNAASVGTLKRFDAIFMFIWLLALIVKISMILVLIKEYGGKIAAFCSAVVVFAFGCSVGGIDTLVAFFGVFSFVVTILLIVIIPLIIIVKGRFVWRISCKKPLQRQ